MKAIHPSNPIHPSSYDPSQTWDKGQERKLMRKLTKLLVSSHSLLFGITGSISKVIYDIPKKKIQVCVSLDCFPSPSPHLSTLYLQPVTIYPWIVASAIQRYILSDICYNLIISSTYCPNTEASKYILLVQNSIEAGEAGAGITATAAGTCKESLNRSWRCSGKTLWRSS